MSGDNTNGDNTTPRDNRQTIIIVLAVVLTILVGLVVGFLVSGGLSGDPAPPQPRPRHRLPRSTHLRLRR